MLVVLGWNLSSVAGATDLDAQIAALGLHRLSGEAVIAPDFTITGLDNKELSLSSFKGRVVLLNFWATW